MVVAFHGAERVASGVVPGRPSPLVDAFDLAGAEDALHGGVVAGGSGRAVAVALAPGQAHELPRAASLDSRPGLPKWVVADRG